MALEEQWIDGLIDRELPEPWEADQVGVAIIKWAARLTAAVLVRAMASDPHEAQMTVERIRREAIRAKGYPVDYTEPS